MSNPPFESLDALKEFISKSSNEQFQEALPLFSLSELAESLTLLQTQPVAEAKNKLHGLFGFINSGVNLETLGKHFTISSFSHFLEFLTQHPESQNQLPYILIGLHPLVFSQALHLLKESHLHLLRQEGWMEPLQYQLTQFVHEGEILKQNIEQKIQLFKQEFPTLIPDQITQDTLHKLINSIDNLRDEFIDYLEKASVALAIVWHTDRIDLIEKLSSINESMQHQLAFLIGLPAFDHSPSSGLYAFLEQSLSNIFDITLKDDDAAIEGMTRLSIWHLKDYWELGLLPFIEHEEELDLEAQTHSEKERWEYQQKLISLVQLQLERLGIGKVGQLKKLHLFSKSLLKAYIREHYHLLIRSLA